MKTLIDNQNVVYFEALIYTPCTSSEWIGGQPYLSHSQSVTLFLSSALIFGQGFIIAES